MTADQLNGLLRQVLPILGTILAVFGMSSATANGIVNLLMSISGPLIAVGSAVWAFVANSRSSIMASAAKPVDAMTPAPLIVLPREEADLAQKLPANVTSK